jgi:Concanavalin A-like lectin/glucanases superfamily
MFVWIRERMRTRTCKGVLLIASLGACAPSQDKSHDDGAVRSLLEKNDASSTGTGAGIGTVDGGIAEDTGGPQPVGSWPFDDCTDASRVLADVSGLAADATRSESITCATGVRGAALSFDDQRDSASADGTFAKGERIAVSAFIQPRSTSRGALVSKGTLGATAFELSLSRGQVVFTVELTNGRRVTSRAPISNLTWSHVAGVYDGTFSFLFVNGQQVGQVAAAGAIRDVESSILFGTSARADAFDGLLDEVWISTDPVTATDIADRACLRGEMSIAITPPSVGPVPPETPATYAVTVANGDRGFCPPRQVNLFFDALEENLTASFDTTFLEIPVGANGLFTLSVAGSSDLAPGSHSVSFSASDFSHEPFERRAAGVDYISAEPTGCFVRTSRELMIVDLSVVEDPARTRIDPISSDASNGVWTFAHLMQNAAPTPADAPAMVEQLFDTWLSDQTINSFAVPARPQMRELVLDHWPRAADGSLDLTQAPVRLLAIVNRMDGRDLAQGHAGEGRFVFGVVDQGFAAPFTLIVEYRLPASTNDDILAWAQRWHALSALPFPSEAYNAALQAITEAFAGRNVIPGAVNGSALTKLRTNENLLSATWELREFQLSAASHMFEEIPVELTPDTSFIHESSLVADFVNQNEATILLQRHVVPLQFEGQPFLAGSSNNDLTGWVSSGITNSEARHAFSLNTCNGCHSSGETGTAFVHVKPREEGVAALLSGFLTGITIPDPATGVPRTFNDLKRRSEDLERIVCAEGASLTKGIQRVH